MIALLVVHLPSNSGHELGLRTEIAIIIDRYNLAKSRNQLTVMLEFINSWLGRHPEQIKAKVEIYTWQTCPFCIRAKLLLWWKGVQYNEYKIDGDEAARSAMAQRANDRRTVPQIFINNQHIGGCDDLYALDSKGKLDSLLAQS